MLTATLTQTDPRADIAELHDAIAHLVAGALDDGGVTWQVAAPTVHELLGDGLTGASPVVVARALGRALTEQARAVDRALAAGDVGAAEALRATLKPAHDRLAGLLAR